MDIKQTLQANFPEVKDAFFEKDANSLFLRIEVSLKTLDEVVSLSRIISDYLDLHEPTEKDYFMDIYSSGAEPFLELENLGQYLEKNILLKLKSKIKEKIDFEGKLLSVDQQSISLR